VRLLDFRRGVTATQSLVLIPKLLDPIGAAFLEAADLAGKLKSRAVTFKYSVPKWDYINPQQDIAADRDEIGAGLASPSEKLRQRGYEPDEVYAEIAADIEQWRKLGILDVLLFMQRGNLPTAPGAAPAAPAKD
jgi:capsid protein